MAAVATHSGAGAVYGTTTAVLDQIHWTAAIMLLSVYTLTGQILISTYGVCGIFSGAIITADNSLRLFHCGCFGDGGK